MKWAYIVTDPDSGETYVHSIFQGDPADRFNPELTIEEVADEVGERWIKQGDGTFVPPPPPQTIFP